MRRFAPPLDAELEQLAVDAGRAPKPVAQADRLNIQIGSSNNRPDAPSWPDAPSSWLQRATSPAALDIGDGERLR